MLGIGGNMNKRNFAILIIVEIFTLSIVIPILIKIMAHLPKLFNNPINLSILCAFLLIIPIVVPVYAIYLLTRYKNEENRFKTMIYSIGFILPFTNFILYILGKSSGFFLYIFKNGFSLDLSSLMFFSLFAGFGWLFILLPIIFIIILLCPKKYFLHKKLTLSTIISTFIFGWILTIIAFNLGSLIEKHSPKTNWQQMVNIITH